MSDHYPLLFAAAIAAFPDKLKQTVQKETNLLWNEIKAGRKDYQTEINRLNTRANRTKSGLLSFWTASRKPKLSTAVASTSSSEVQVEPQASTDQQPTVDVPSSNTSEEQAGPQQTEAKGDTPAQKRAKEDLSAAEKRISDLTVVKTSVGLSDDHRKELASLMKKKCELEKKVTRLQSLQIAQQKFRDKKKRALSDLEINHPEAAKRLKTHKRAGKPPLESQENLAGLHDVILNLVRPSSSADDRRRTEVYNSCQTLDNLKATLSKAGYTVTRTALYYRLAPSNVNHQDGKRHVHTVPVKLLKPQAVARKAHIDHEFAKAVWTSVEEFACLFDQKTVFYLSQDDKAKVPLGLPISKKQTAVLMHVEYKVCLPDHDFPIGSQHKLIPSVYASCVMKEGKISFSGPTYIAIRSQKHDSSTAQTHQHDFEKLSVLEEFKASARGSDGLLKPLLFVAVDSGPDEAPNNEKTMLAWVDCFNRHDLDGIFVFSNAPGFSAFNKVERRMASLSKDTSGIILPFDKFGSHLDKSNKTNNLELEKKNFAAAGEILASVWSETVIDNFPVVAKWIDPAEGSLSFGNAEQKWIDNHVSQSRYILQIVKCKDLSCCTASRTNYDELLGSRFIPPPVPLKVGNAGPNVHAEGKFGGLFQNLWLSHTTNIKVFDTHCPKMNLVKHKSGVSELNRRICPKCGIYYPTLKALQRHRSACQNIVFATDLEEQDGLREDAEDQHEQIEAEPAAATQRLNVFDRLNRMFGI